MAVNNDTAATLSNLVYCTPDVRAMVESVLADDSVRAGVKDAIRAGLQRDSLYASRDADIVAGTLEAVFMSCRRLTD